MTEAQLQEHVRLMCAQLGLYHYHPHDSRRSERGWPDSTILNRRTGHLMFRELKSATGDLSVAQREIRWILQAGGHDYAVWRPADLTSGRIAHELAALAAWFRLRTAAGPCYGAECDHISHQDDSAPKLAGFSHGPAPCA